MVFAQAVLIGGALLFGVYGKQRITQKHRQKQNKDEKMKKKNFHL